MKLPTFSRPKPTAPTNIEASLPTTSAAFSSQSSSTTQIEKETSATANCDLSITSKASKGLETKVIEKTPLEEAVALDKLSDEPEYPTGAKLGIIVASLCLSVFCMALVGPDVAC